jgi:stage V sporulation protein SpoVS
MEIIQVSATSPASAVAQAISSVVHEYHCAVVQAIGVDAYQRVKQALTLATGYLQHDGIGVSCVRKRKTVVVDNKHVTLIKVMVKVTTTSSPCPHFFPDSSSNTLIKAKDLPRA